MNADSQVAEQLRSVCQYAFIQNALSYAASAVASIHATCCCCRVKRGEEGGGDRVARVVEQLLNLAAILVAVFCFFLLVLFAVAHSKIDHILMALCVELLQSCRFNYLIKYLANLINIE